MITHRVGDQLLPAMSHITGLTVSPTSQMVSGSLVHKTLQPTATFCRSALLHISQPYRDLRNGRRVRLADMERGALIAPSSTL
jgi:hypothetical protein